MKFKFVCGLFGYVSEKIRYESLKTTTQCCNVLSAHCSCACFVFSILTIYSNECLIGYNVSNVCVYWNSLQFSSFKSMSFHMYIVHAHLMFASYKIVLHCILHSAQCTVHRENCILYMDELNLWLKMNTC